MPNNNFLIQSISHNKVRHLFSLSDSELTKINAIKIIVDKSPGYPCRVSLEDAEIGETIIALPYRHHDVKSPYRSSGPIFIREKCTQANLEINEIPDVLTSRLLSLRAYNKQALMINALITEGKDTKKSLIKLLSNQKVSYIHIHNANPGCYSCCVERVIK